MKEIKVLSCILVLILFSALFSGCGEMTPEKIMKLPADYTLEQAQKDGMIYVSSDGVSDEKIQKINDFFGQYGETGSSGKSEKYLYLIDERKMAMQPDNSTVSQKNLAQVFCAMQMPK